MRFLPLFGLLVSSIASADVVINEFLPDPDSTDTDKEWIEIYNNGGAQVDITGWKIRAATSTFATKYTFPATTTIDPGEYIVVAGSLAGITTPHIDGLGFGNATSSADAVKLEDDTGATIDMVIYGTPNTDKFIGDNGDTTMADKPGADESLARVTNGV
ncbi:MAG: lamin tail domain-containing protein, partial [Proteobacteria bacterium]|nr:lamin tail domain-containing protein [Pseudomonadota bacterium]